MTKLDAHALRSAFGNYMTGVTIVTAVADDGTPVGFTANSFTSVSMDPPLLLVCPGNHLSSLEVFRNCGHFTVNVLAENQQEISNNFASSKGKRFEVGDWSSDINGAPFLSDVVARFSCSTHQVIEAGDHLVLIGQVDDFATNDGLGLGYWKGGYFSLSQEREAQVSSTTGQTVIVGSLIDDGASIFVEIEDEKLKLPTTVLKDESKARAGVGVMHKQLGLEAQIGRVYSVFHNAKNDKRFIYFRAGMSDGEKHPTATTAGHFVNLSDVAKANWLDPTEAVMVNRYLSERETNQFGLYIGASDSGEVHHENQPEFQL